MAPQHPSQKPQPLIDRQIFNNLLGFFSVSAEEAFDWGVVAPFIRFDWGFAYWPFSFHVLHPDLSMLTLLTRKFSRLWDNTVGASLSQVGPWLGKQIPRSPDLIVSSLKKKNPFGDIDLAVYDLKRRHLVLCEIKTVFDKFRTNYQLTNFLNQKVNFDKAKEQVLRNVQAVTSGAWPLKEIFTPEQINSSPLTVTPLILTWWDLHNPNLELGDAVLCCNFRSFIYLMNAAAGNVDDVVHTIRQCSKLYCPAAILDSSISGPAGPI